MNETIDEDKEEEEDSLEDNPSKATLIALLSCVFTANLLYLNSVSLLPQYVDEYYPQLTVCQWVSSSLPTKLPSSSWLHLLGTTFPSLAGEGLSLRL